MAQGRIRSDFDAYQLAKIFSNLITQTTTQIFYDDNYTFETIQEDINTLINIFKKGIETK
ncbi:MAG: hypothetical protein UMR38_05805 [Candidatus Izemoplasma sp.]|nr:hypothetical protein [Candidatus Izemoplasma sp.]